MGWSTKVLGLSLILTLLIQCSLPLQAAELEGFDEPTVEELPSHYRQQRAAQALHADIGQATPVAAATAGSAAGQAAKPAQAQGQKRPVSPMLAGWQAGLNRKNMQFEALAIFLLVAYAGNLFWGRRYNQQLAVAFTRTFLAPGGVFEKNFSLIGPGDSDEVLMGEGYNCFKLYASGRRHCQGMLATLNLAPRQDLLSSMYALIDPQDDILDIQVYMNEASLPQTVLAVAPPKVMRILLQDKADVSAYTKRVAAFEPVGGSAWPKDKLQVQAEHTAFFYEVFSDSRVSSVFNNSNSEALRHFRSLHITSENSAGSHKRVLSFSFRLPSASHMADISGLVSLVPQFIDLVGSYKMPPEAVRKAVTARQKSEAAVASEEEERKKRMEAAQAKKLEKMQAEKERVARMTPEAKQKHMDKMAKQAMKDALKSKIRTKK